MAVMAPEKIISRHPLQNGLTLEIWDRSRPVAGDRWLLVCEARITVPVAAPTLPLELRSQADDVIAALGRELVFSQKDERNFIDAKEAPVLLQEMADRLAAMAPRYFGHPDFAAKFISKKYAEWQQQRRWRQG